jgi:hypothetical protein
MKQDEISKKRKADNNTVSSTLDSESDSDSTSDSTSSAEGTSEPPTAPATITKKRKVEASSSQNEPAPNPRVPSALEQSGTKTRKRGKKKGGKNKS